MPLDLPLEIWLQILEHLPTTELCILCRTSLKLHDLATPILYHHVKLYGVHGRIYDAPSPDRSTFAINMLLTRPEVANYVKICSISRWASGPEYSTMLQLLPQLPRLTTLRVSGIVDDHLCRTISGLAQLDTLNVEYSVLACPQPYPPPPRLRSLSMLGSTGEREESLGIVCLFNYPELIDVFLSSTVHVTQVIEQWKTQSHPTCIRNFNIRSTSRYQVEHIRKFIFDRCPAIEKLSLLPGSLDMDLIRGSTPNLRWFVGSLESARRILPGRPVGVVEVDCEAPKDEVPLASTLRYFLDSLTQTTTSLLELSIRIQMEMNTTLPWFIRDISSRFLNLWRLTVRAQGGVKLEQALDNMSDNLIQLQDLESLSLHCFVHPPSDTMLAIENDFVMKFEGKMVKLKEVSFSPLCTWKKEGGMWQVEGDGIRSTPVIRAFANSLQVPPTRTSDS